MLQAVVERMADQLAATIEAAVVPSATGYERVEAVLTAVFRLGVRQPAVLGLLREPTTSAPMARSMRSTSRSPTTQTPRPCEQRSRTCSRMVSR